MRLILFAVWAHLLCVTFADPTFESSIKQFGNDLLKHVDHKEKNVIFSPFNIATGLSMLMRGANGTTKSQIQNTLKMGNVTDISEVDEKFKNIQLKYIDWAKSDENVKIVLVNMFLYSNKTTIKPSYENAIKENYKALVASKDFVNDGEQIVKDINGDVKYLTHDLIPKLYEEPLDAETLMVLINTLYFKGKWSRTFLPAYTNNRTFYNSDKTESTVPMMFDDNGSHRHKIDNEHNVTMLELDYQGNASMYILLPHERYGLQRALNLPIETIREIITKMTKGPVALSLPRFKFDHKINLKKTLLEMGLTLPFTAGADLSGMTDEAVYVSSATHKAVISVDESGTEAAAVTEMRIVPYSAFIGTEIVIDHPFAFVIFDKVNGLPLFVGAVNKL